ncbi:hypothetical protein [Methylobacter sp. BlB1]|uniref:hypothetical protein n=1 Tax=unclassified Methylobacter TaxID=2635283 RepID=UPI00189310E6|nr:hypothetical protein [Methylobacter sp. BlB1]MBF6647853.1 hypothetical protein [Methylobacter sp. BlB1]
MKRKAGFFILSFALSGMAYAQDSKELSAAAMSAADKQNVMAGQKTTHEIIFKLLQEDSLSIGMPVNRSRSNNY